MLHCIQSAAIKIHLLKLEYMILTAKDCFTVFVFMPEDNCQS